jgi:hypothetical protein
MQAMTAVHRCRRHANPLVRQVATPDAASTYSVLPLNMYSYRQDGVANVQYSKVSFAQELAEHARLQCLFIVRPKPFILIRQL